MRQFTGNWRVVGRRDGAARLILKSKTGEEVYFDLSPVDLIALRRRADELSPPKAQAPKSTNTLRSIPPRNAAAA